MLVGLNVLNVGFREDHSCQEKHGRERCLHRETQQSGALNPTYIYYNAGTFFHAVTLWFHPEKNITTGPGKIKGVFLVRKRFI
jgi:hypothetical protein